MLVITRQTGDSVLVGENIRITVLEVSGDRVKIGIDAPRSIPILRSEVLETLDVNREASSSGGALPLPLPLPLKPRRLEKDPGKP